MGFGYDNDNKRFYIKIWFLCKATKNVNVLAGLYACAGYDYTPSFYEKEKKTTGMTERHPRLLEVFTKLGVIEPNDPNQDLVKEFVSLLEDYFTSKLLFTFNMSKETNPQLAHKCCDARKT